MQRDRQTDSQINLERQSDIMTERLFQRGRQKDRKINLDKQTARHTDRSRERLTDKKTN